MRAAPPADPPRPRFDRPALVVILFAVTVFLAWLGSRGLNDPDEGRFAEIGREMAAGGDWVVPRLNGIPHFQKPPMLYWLTALSIRGFGVNEWAVRLPSALAATGTVVLAMATAGLLFGSSARWKTGLILATGLEFFLLARVITTDMLLTFWITAAVSALVVHARGGGRLALCAFYAAMGLGFLTKGPMALVVPGSAAVAWHIGRRRAGGAPPRMFWWIGLPATLAIALSWFLVLCHRFPALWEYFTQYELVQRVASNVHRRNEPFWFHAVVLAGGLLPWTVFVPGLVARAWRRLRAGDPDAYLFLGWIVVPFVVLSLARSKLATYVLPLIPPMAILLARGWDRAAGSRAWRGTVMGLAAACSLALAALPFALRGMETHYGRPIVLSPWFFVGLAAAVGMFLAALALAWKSRAVAWVLPILASATAVFMVTLASQADRLILGGKATLREAALAIAPAARDPAVPVFVFNTRANSMEFYLQRLVARTEAESDIVLPLDEEQRRRIVRQPRPFLEQIESGPAFVLAGMSRYRDDEALHNWRILHRVGTRVILAPNQQGPALPRRPDDAAAGLPRPQ